jgi:hypothetical protein
VIVAHVAGLPVEEVLPVAVATGATLLAALRVRLRDARRRSRPG